MAIPADEIVCTGGGFTVRNWHRPVSVVYKLADGRAFGASQGRAPSSRGVRATGSATDPNALPEGNRASFGVGV
jgi:hypothetical protein